MGVDYSLGDNGRVFGEDGDLIHVYAWDTKEHLFTMHQDELDDNVLRPDLLPFVTGHVSYLRRDWRVQ